VYFDGTRVAIAETKVTLLHVDEACDGVQRLLRQKLFDDARNVLNKSVAYYKGGKEPYRVAKASAALDLVRLPTVALCLWFFSHFLFSSPHAHVITL